PHGYPHDLPSFPTRRSSDLVGLQAGADAAVDRPARGRSAVLDREDVPAGLRRVPAAPDQTGRRVGVEERAVDGGARQLERDRRRSEEHTSELQSLAYLVCRL